MVDFEDSTSNVIARVWAFGQLGTPLAEDLQRSILEHQKYALVIA
jgi:hypothetical protein